RKIVNENQVIAVENLNVKGMVRNHNLAKAISDCGWGMFCTMLKYKAENEGKTYIEVDRWFPSSKILGLKPRRRTTALPLNTSAFTKYMLKCETWKKPIRFDFTPHPNKSRYCGALWAV
ncbi:MAG: IS200/IS605 family accessory protein TnpB-related protein, partial [Pirellulaceae bacterium]